MHVTIYILNVIYIYSVTIHHPGCRISYSSPEVILRSLHKQITFGMQIVTFILIHYIKFGIRKQKNRL